MKTILAIDLGKFKSCFCKLDANTGEITFFTEKTSRQNFYWIFQKIRRYDPIVLFEAGCQAGWVADMLREMKIEFKVANVNHPAWRWKENQSKSDKKDAQRLIRMYNSGFFPQIYVPSRQTREKRSLLAYREKLVWKIKDVKNFIRGLMTSRAIDLPTGRKCWTKEFRGDLTDLAIPIESMEDIEMLWKCQLSLAIRQLEQLETMLKTVEKKLDTIAEEDKRIALLRTIPGVGPRTAEALAYVIDDPHRFKSSRQVASYVGLCPRRYNSGNTDYSGSISKQGNKLLRALLTQAAWSSLQSGWSAEIYKRVRQGSSKRSTIAIIAVARHILIRAWAMLRDDCRWDESKFKIA